GRRFRGNDAVRRPGDRRTARQASERPRLLIGRTALRDRLPERPRQLGAHGCGESLAAADRLPHLAQLLRTGLGSARLPASADGRPARLGGVLLLARVQAARHALPQVPQLGAALHGTRMLHVRAEDAPELVDADLVAGVAEAGTQEEARQVEPARLVLGT